MVIHIGRLRDRYALKAAAHGSEQEQGNAMEAHEHPPRNWYDVIVGNERRRLADWCAER
jgi:hypothetical protein